MPHQYGRSRSRGGARPIGDILAGLMARKGYAQVAAAQEFDDAWKSAAGALAADSRPGKLQRGVLQIWVRNSAVLQELSFRTRDLLRVLQERVPQAELRELRFRVGTVD